MTIHLVYRPAFRSVAFRSKQANRRAQVREYRFMRRIVAGTIRPLIWAAGIAVGMAVWAIAGEMGFALPFAIQKGVLSHWQVWFAAGALTICAVAMLLRIPPAAGSNEAATDAFRAA
jgi:hypothetical protein